MLSGLYRYSNKQHNSKYSRTKFITSRCPDIVCIDRTYRKSPTLLHFTFYLIDFRYFSFGMIDCSILQRTEREDATYNTIIMLI